jgi:hypothetical protein
MNFKKRSYSSRLGLRRVAVLIAFGLCFFISGNLSAQTQTVYKALIVDGFSNHD